METSSSITKSTTGYLRKEVMTILSFLWGGGGRVDMVCLASRGFGAFHFITYHASFLSIHRVDRFDH